MSSFNEELLIEAVRRHPEVYDQSDKAYYDQTATRNAWDAVSEVTNVSGTCTVFIKYSEAV